MGHNTRLSALVIELAAVHGDLFYMQINVASLLFYKMYRTYIPL